MTDKFNPNDASHLAIKQELMHYIALNEIATPEEVNQALEAEGFSVIEGMDMGASADQSTPWYQPMETRHGALGKALRRIPWGRRGVYKSIEAGRSGRIVPEGRSGSSPTHESDCRGLCRGRQLGHIHSVVLFPGSQAPLDPDRAGWPNAWRTVVPSTIPLTTRCIEMDAGQLA